MRSSISAALCLIAWKVAIGRSNCTRSLAYSTARSKACCIDPSVSAHSATAPSSTTRRHTGGVVARRADRLGRQVVEGRCGRSGGSRRAPAPAPPTGAAPGTCRCPPGCGPGPAPSPPTHRRAPTVFVPLRRHWPDLRLARVRMRSTTSPWPSSSIATVPRVAPVASGSSRSSSPRRGRGGGRQHRRGQERPGQRQPAHLLEHHHHLEQAGARTALLLGHQQADPPEVDQLPPQVVGDAGAVRGALVVVEHRPDVGRRRLVGEERPGRVLQGLLVVVEGELHYIATCSAGRPSASGSRTVLAPLALRSLTARTLPDARVRSSWQALRVDFAYTAEDEAFRDELIGWLDEHLPKFLAEWAERGRATSRPRAAAGSWAQMERRRAWQRKLNEGRWAAITWPEEWGGRDATVTQNVIYSEAMARYRTPGIYNANGLWQIGPMIIRWGTDEQKHRWIPNILDAVDHWCQGFSEPAGRQRPRQPPHDRDRRRRRLRARRPEDLDLERPHREVGAVPRPHRPRRDRRGPQARGHHRADHRPRGPRHRHPTDPRHRRRGDVLRGLLRRSPGAGGLPPRRRGRGLAGRHGHARLGAGRAPPAWPSACGPTSTRWSAWPAR